MTLLELANLLMTPHQTATFLKVTLTTLEDWRRKGTGPKWLRLNGRVVRYYMADVEEWLQASSAPVTGPAKGTPKPPRRSSLCIES
jgi:predicted DNA-binding transcriptional regulator AlpA